jgi:multiple sugar transport system substrate-binding protein
MKVRFALGTGLVFLAALVLVACGSSGGSSSRSTSGGSNNTSKAAAVDPAAMNTAKGHVTYCAGKDTSGDLKQGIANFNAKYKAQGLSASLLEFPESADEQHNQFVQREKAKSAECDGFESDVIWTAEFASQGYLLDMSKYIQSRNSEFVPSTLQSINYQGKDWGVPRATDAGFLYYRTDVVKKPPTTWQEVYSQAKTTKPQGIVYQGAAYEGLTCSYLELALAAGGSVLSADGKKSTFNNPANVAALQFMVDGIKNGAAPKAVTTYMEEPARRAFEAGTVSFMRNWPYAYALDQMAPKIKGKFAVMPFPSWQGGGKAGILGGHNMVISAYSKNPSATLKFIDYMTSAESMKLNAVKYSKAPVLTATYADPAVKKAIPFASELEQAVAQAKSRPVSPVYPLISQAIYKNVNAALSGGMSAADAVKQADADITKALSTF